MRILFALTASFAATLFVNAPVLAKNTPPSPVQLILEEAKNTASPAIASATKPNQATQQTLLRSQNSSIGASLNQDLKIEGKNTQTHEGIDLVRLSIGNDATRHKAMQDKLTAAYGTPKSQRGGIQIWEIQNNDQGYDQSKMTTIMTGQEDGNFFVTIDRRGNSGRTLPPPKAVISAPRAATPPRNIAPKRPKIDYSIRD